MHDLEHGDGVVTLQVIRYTVISQVPVDQGNAIQNSRIETFAKEENVTVSSLTKT